LPVRREDRHPAVDRALVAVVAHRDADDLAGEEVLEVNICERIRGPGHRIVEVARDATFVPSGEKAAA